MAKINEGEDKNEFGYTKDDVKRNRDHFWRALLQEREEHGNQLTIIAFPEGTRSKDGTIQQPARGFEKYFHFLSPTIVIPLGLSFPGAYNRGLNMFKTQEVYVGAPLYIRNGKNEEGDPVTIQSIMDGIQAMLPPDRHRPERK